MKVLLFVKAPQRGTVKTRLAADIGEAKALRIYEKMGRRVVDQLSPWFDLTVCFDPPDAEPAIQGWLGAVPCRPQTDGDLGHRLEHAFAEHFDRHPKQPAAAIGADTPDLDASVMMTAQRALREAEVVIGPSIDGGYYMLALRSPCPELFRNIPWSTERVFDLTVERCRALGIEPHVLDPLRDVDTEADARAVGVL